MTRCLLDPALWWRSGRMGLLAAHGLRCVRTLQGLYETFALLDSSGFRRA